MELQEKVKGTLCHQSFSCCNLSALRQRGGCGGKGLGLGGVADDGERKLPPHHLAHHSLQSPQRPALAVFLQLWPSGGGDGVGKGNLAYLYQAAATKTALESGPKD